MKKLSVLFVMVLLLVVAMPVRAYIPELYTDKIVTVGVVQRVYFHLRRCDDVTQACQWHYFGTDPDDRPPTTDDPVNEYAYVQFPTAFDLLGDDAMSTMYDLAFQAGRAREGLESVGIAAVFTDSYVDAGVSRTFGFHLMTYDRVWYYFGTDPAVYPPMPVGDVIEVSAVQFPRDLGELGDEANDALYEIGMRAGLAREGIE